MKKKNLLTIACAVFIFIAGAFLFSSCNPDDTTAPVITLSGATLTVDFGGTFTDPGATATDDEDGNVTVNVTGTVNTSSADTYTLTYTATDAAGNQSSKTRTVYVTHRNSNISHAYTVTESCTIAGDIGPYDASITSGGASNMAIVFTNFGDFSTSVTLNGDLTGNMGRDLDIATQTVTGMSFEGSGTVNKGGTVLSISYTVDDGTDTDNCTATWTQK
jgi:hypothetical protein